MRLHIRLLTALALVSLITGGALPAAAQDKVRLLLDWFVNPDHAALVIAKQRGIFTRHGLDVELIAPADPNAPPKLVAAGQAEYAVSYQPTLQMLVAEGLPLVRVGVLVAQPLNSLVVLEDGPVKSIADFKGRKIGYSIAGFEEALLGAILEKAGLTLKDVTLININFALTTALMSKQVDGVIGAFRNFELNDLALHKAKGRLWEVEKNGVPAYDELVLITKRETVDVARTKKLLAAITEATTWLKANPDEAWGIFSKSGKELDSELNKLAWKDTLPLLAADPTALDRARYTAFADFLVKRGLIKQAPPLDSYLREIK
ncbi:MAG TPA: ABC transporter substrate-binding protein [Reyranella sp.]|jgi:putative hydroxymethylpyrimidine transport system substrate-binding protein|nr:ABC transporter substrate-binding protein [Reyranella sp.]